MPTFRTALRSAPGFAAIALALSMAPAAYAQDDALPALPELPPVGSQASPMPAAPVLQSEAMSQVEVNSLPAEYRRLPVAEETSITSIDEDGVETVTRTRRITSTAPSAMQYTPAPPQVQYAPAAYPQPAYNQAPYYQNPYYQAGSQTVVLDQDQWLEECERRTSGRSRRDRGGIIGGLLGAIGGGIGGNLIAGAGSRLGGTLIGAGVGGIAGVLLGNLFDGDDDERRYDCEGALNAWLNQNNTQGTRFASRVIPAPVAPAPQYAYPATGYGYAQAPAYYYPPQQTMAMIPVTTYQQQRVIVRETVREEMVPGATRSIPRPAPVPAPSPLPSPKMIKQAPAPYYAPAPSSKMVKE